MEQLVTHYRQVALDAATVVHSGPATVAVA
jgi:hypothetical protein